MTRDEIRLIRNHIGRLKQRRQTEGVALTVRPDIQAFADYLRSHDNVLHEAIDPEVNDLNGNSCFWTCAELDGDIVAGVAIRLFDGWSIADLVRSGRAWRPLTLAEPVDDNLPLTDPVLNQRWPRVGQFAGLFVDPAHRGLHLPGDMMQITRWHAMLAGDADVLFGLRFNTRDDQTRTLIRYGYSHIVPGPAGIDTGKGVVDLILAYVTREEAVAALLDAAACEERLTVQSISQAGIDGPRGVHDVLIDGASRFARVGNRSMN